MEKIVKWYCSFCKAQCLIFQIYKNQGWEFDHRFFDWINNFSKDRIIDLILKKNKSKRSIFYKDRRDRFDQGSMRSIQSCRSSKMSEDGRSTEAIRSFGIKRGTNCQKHKKNGQIPFFWSNWLFFVIKRPIRYQKWKLIFFKDRRDRFDHGPSF